MTTSPAEPGIEASRSVGDGSVLGPVRLAMSKRSAGELDSGLDWESSPVGLPFDGAGAVGTLWGRTDAGTSDGGARAGTSRRASKTLLDALGFTSESLPRAAGCTICGKTLDEGALKENGVRCDWDLVSTGKAPTHCVQSGRSHGACWVAGPRTAWRCKRLSMRSPARFILSTKMDCSDGK